MANLLDYLKAHGHVPFEEAPLNEADNLALCQLAYCDLSSAVPPLEQRHSVTFGQAWRRYANHGGTTSHKNDRLFRAMARSVRFRNVRLAGFREHFDSDAHEQFAAYTAILPDGASYVAFRGTNHHISGWRENFMMSYMVVGAQREARRYLDEVGRASSGTLHVGGHSKGGNLAAYAVAFCNRQTRSRISDVWCNDPPGFVREVVDFGAFDPVVGRMHLFVPEFCVVAGIMEQVMQPTVIRSASSHYLQHDALTWQIESGNFVRSEAVAPECRQVWQAFHQFIYTRSRTDRLEITNDLFDAISLAGIETIGDFAHGGLRTVQRLLTRFHACHAKTRTAVRDLIVSLAAERAASALARVWAMPPTPNGSAAGA